MTAPCRSLEDISRITIFVSFHFICTKTLENTQTFHGIFFETGNRQSFLVPKPDFPVPILIVLVSFHQQVRRTCGEKSYYSMKKLQIKVLRLLLMLLLALLVTVTTNFIAFAHETGKFTLSYRQYLMTDENLDNQKLQIVIFNKTTKPRKFIFYQKDKHHEKIKNTYFVYVWNSRLLKNKAYWNFILPLTFQVAGLSGDAADYSTTNIENANYGQIWQLIQQKPEGTEFSIKKNMNLVRPQTPSGSRTRSTLQEEGQFS